MATSPTSEIAPDSDTTCDCIFWTSACLGEAFYREHNSKRYCVLHFPGKEKRADFERAFQRKIKKQDFEFRGVWFPEDARFFDVEFSKAADFTDATFSARADFRYAIFNMVSFRNATFLEDAMFGETNFNLRADFVKATFSSNADFNHSTFSRETNFSLARFRGPLSFEHVSFKAAAMFSGAMFGDHVLFAKGDRATVFSNTSSLDLQFARIEKPEHFSFHTLTARPSWFVNVDARNFEFINVDWNRRSIQDEIESLKSSGLSSPYRIFAIACRNLAVNAEEYHRYEEASGFRYMAMDARRLEHFRGFAVWRLSWWYWLASGYGERVLRAAVVLLGILLLSAVLYTQVGFARWEPRITSEPEAATAKRDETGAPLKLARVLTYSAAVMTFQRPEPRPATTTAQIIVLLETILGPVQAALLALAIRRKFMR